MREKMLAGWAWVRARRWWWVMLFALAVLAAFVRRAGLTRAEWYCVIGLHKDCKVLGVAPGKTAWDFVELTLVPLALAVVGYFFSLKERQAEQDIAKYRAMDDALKSYLDAMGSLLTDKGLSDSEPPEHVRDLARAYTLTALRRLDGERKGAVVRFLHEAKLISADRVKVDLSGANLQGANLQRANLQGANLQGADLQGVNLQKANLQKANLQKANLQGAWLQRAFLPEANLQEANLQGANLQGAFLPEAILHMAKLQRAILQGAYLKGAFLSAAKLQRAELQEANLPMAILYMADLQEAKLQGAWLQGAGLTGVHNLEQAQLDSTIAYQSVKNLPAGLTPDPRPWPGPADDDAAAADAPPDTP